MSVAKFKVKSAKFDAAGAEGEGTVTINRETGSVVARRKGSRTSYETTLARVANYVCQMGFPNKANANEED